MGEVRTYWILRAWVWGPDEGTCVVVSSPATPPKNRRGESLGALAKFLGYADVAFSIPELPIRSTRRAFT